MGNNFVKICSIFYSYHKNYNEIMNLKMFMKLIVVCSGENYIYRKHFDDSLRFFFFLYMSLHDMIFVLENNSNSLYLYVFDLLQTRGFYVSWCRYVEANVVDVN